MLRTVGDVPVPAARDSDRPVDEWPKVRGREVVWRVSFGREAIVCSFEERQDMVEHEGGRVSE